MAIVTSHILEGPVQAQELFWRYMWSKQMLKQNYYLQKMPLTNLFRKKEQIINHMLWFASELLSQNRILKPNGTHQMKCKLQALKEEK